MRITRPDNKFPRDEAGGRMSVEGLDVHIGDGHILRNVNLTIPERQITCVIGPSGCGKSTLLRAMNRLVDSTEGARVSGRILLGGDDIVSSTRLTDLRRRIGLGSQKPTPLPMSIFENVAYGCRIHGIRGARMLRLVVRHYLESVGLWDEVAERLHTPASRLSIGQQQRLCLARSLAVEPQFILADEATSALDPISSKLVEELFVRLKRDYSIIMVTHTLRQARRIADHVVFMYLGEVVESGPAEQVFETPRHEMTKKYLTGAFS